MIVNAWAPDEGRVNRFLHAGTPPTDIVADGGQSRHSPIAQARKTAEPCGLSYIRF